MVSVPAASIAWASRMHRALPTDKPSQSRLLGWGYDEALFSEKKGVFREQGGGNSVNEGFGKDFYSKGNSAKRSGPFSEPPDCEN